PVARIDHACLDSRLTRAQRDHAPRADRLDPAVANGTLSASVRRNRSNGWPMLLNDLPATRTETFAPEACIFDPRSTFRVPGAARSRPCRRSRPASLPREHPVANQRPTSIIRMRASNLGVPSNLLPSWKTGLQDIFRPACLDSTRSCAAGSCEKG